MDIILYINNSEKEKVIKSITQVGTLSGYIKEPSSIVHPVIMIEYSDPTAFNYCYIEEFGRYYYVDDVTVVHNNLMRISLTVDVLYSFKDEILSQNVIIEKNTLDYDKYLPEENLVTKVKTKTDIINFGSGFLESGEFILITAGGG